MTTQTLGYYDLMNIAEQNSEQSQRDALKVKLPSYKGSKNKKEDPKSRELTENVRKFLAKQNEERQRQEKEARQKREKLVQLRSKDRKAKGRVNRMLKMTKSANKSAIADADNCLNDAIVDQHDELQPDDDDYGYVSQASIEMHKKLLAQYKTIKKSAPTAPERVKNVPVPEVHTLNKSKSGREETYSPEKEKKKSKKPPPPSAMLSYLDLLTLANEKKDIPPAIPVVKSSKSEGKDAESYEYGRPMTAKEKKEYMAEKALRDRVAKQVENGTFRLKPASDAPRAPPPPKSKKSISFKIPKTEIEPPSPPSPPPQKLPPPKSEGILKKELRREEVSFSNKRVEREPVPGPSRHPEKVIRYESPSPPPPPVKVKVEPPEPPPRPKAAPIPLNPYMDFVPNISSRKIEKSFKSSTHESSAPKNSSSRPSQNNHHKDTKQSSHKSSLSDSHRLKNHHKDVSPPPTIKKPKIEPLRHEPESRRYEPEPRRHEPESRRYEPEPRRHEPEPRRHEPEPRRHEPESRRYEPEPRRYEPEPRRYEPEPRRYEPEPRRHEPESRRHEPESRNSKPKAREVERSYGRQTENGHEQRKRFDERRDDKPKIIHKNSLHDSRPEKMHNSSGKHHEQSRMKSRPSPPRYEEKRKAPAPETHKRGRQVIDSSEEEEEEYDSEMDDFIDDSDCNPNTISAMIRQITGYDKRRYRPEDEEECMETSAYDQMREESRSLRIGIKEDLEDMRKEEEEKRRKMMKLKEAGVGPKKKSKGKGLF